MSRSFHREATLHYQPVQWRSSRSFATKVGDGHEQSGSTADRYLRLGHCSLPAYPARTQRRRPTLPRLPLCLSRAASALLQHCILCILPVPAIRRLGQEGIAMVYTRYTGHLVDRPAD